MARNESYGPNVRAIVSLLTVIIAFSIFFLFYVNIYTILISGNFNTLMILTVTVMGLLMVLIYLVDAKSFKKS